MSEAFRGVEIPAPAWPFQTGFGADVKPNFPSPSMTERKEVCPKLTRHVNIIISNYIFVTTIISVLKSSAYHILCIIRWMQRGETNDNLWKTADFVVENLWKKFHIAEINLSKPSSPTKKGRQNADPFS